MGNHVFVEQDAITKPRKKKHVIKQKQAFLLLVPFSFSFFYIKSSSSRPSS